MTNSIFSRLFGGKQKTAAEKAEAQIDLSRAIPGYVPPMQTFTGEPTKAAKPAQDTPAPEMADEDEQPFDLTSLVDETPAEQSIDLPEPALPASALPEDKAEAAVDALSDKHDEWARNDLDRLAEAWGQAYRTGNVSNHLDEVRLVAHDLKGMATVYGHPAISRLATSLCTLLDANKADEQVALINLHVEACRAAYQEGRGNSGNDTVAQSVCVALETQVSRTLTA